MRRPIQVMIGVFVAGVLIVGVVAAQRVSVPPTSAPPLPSAPAKTSASLPPAPASNDELPPATLPAPASDRTDTPRGAPHDGGSAPETGEPPRDPTLPGPQLREWLDSTKLGRDLPTIELKGRVLGGQQPGTVILEIDKNLRVVREGDELSLTGSRPGGVSVRVVEVSDQQVRLEIQPFARNLTLY